MKFAFFNTIIDLIWPPISLLSDNRVKINGTIEIEKWQNLAFNYGPKCHCCGVKLNDAPNPETICGQCLAEPPFFDSARAPLSYDDNSKQLILQLKHAGRRDGVKTFATMMRDCAINPELVDVIIPVPIHKKRLFDRGFNQSVWLGQELAKILNKDFDAFILKRTKNTPSQNGLSQIGRINNVKSAFFVQKPVTGKSILLIDDVFTTGATINACSKALKRAGAKRIDVLTLMRVNSHTNSNEADMTIGIINE